MPGFPVLSRDLTHYPEALAVPAPQGTPSPTALRLAALLRAGYEKG
jgi:hypothetical protein